MYELVQEESEATKDELLGFVDVDATGYAAAASVWWNMVKGKDTLADMPGVEKLSAELSTWRYAGDRDE